MQIFLSYASADEGLARLISELLAQHGLNVWLAKDHIFPGDNWASVVGKALEESNVMVVLATKNYENSPWTRSELEFALANPNYEGRVIPLVFRDGGKPWFPLQLRAISLDLAAPSEAVAAIVQELSQKATLDAAS
ncbi:MAG: toll/interleukin-1 receptor domain-containing protein [Fimbriimonas sp.]